MSAFISAWVVVGSTTTWKVQAASGQNHGTVYATATGGLGTTNKASYIRAIKFA